jgi:hypothetical protein
LKQGSQFGDTPIIVPREGEVLKIFARWDVPFEKRKA